MRKIVKYEVIELESFEHAVSSRPILCKIISKDIPNVKRRHLLRFRVLLLRFHYKAVNNVFNRTILVLYCCVSLPKVTIQKAALGIVP